MNADIFTQIRVNNIRASLRCGVMNHLVEFARINIKNAMLDRDHNHALAALVELRRIYSALDMIYPGDFFAEEIKHMDAGLDRLHRATRTSLMKDYVRSQDPAEVMSISETLSECIAADRSWDWEPEFDAALAEQMAS
jgi:hypothetical protein